MSMSDAEAFVEALSADNKLKKACERYSHSGFLNMNFSSSDFLAFARKLGYSFSWKEYVAASYGFPNYESFERWSKEYSAPEWGGGPLA